jgi:RNA polymerase sigma-70 factor (ECF subfamily)
MSLLAEDPIPTRYSLLGRLQNWDDQDSWKDFFDTYWRLIYSVARKSGLTEAESQDVVQETVISVAKNIQKFRRDRELGSFKGWLRNITRWRIADRLRKRTKLPREDVDPAEIPVTADADSESLWDAEWHNSLVHAAMQRVKARVKEEHYQIFDLYVVQQWPVTRVAQTLGVNVGQVYLAKHRVSALIKKELRALEKQWS